MNATLSIDIDTAQGALLRVLGAIERRGWIVTAMTFDRLDTTRQHLDVTLERQAWHSGSVAVLVRHVEKLICVRSVSVEASGDAEAPGPTPVSLSAAATPRNVDAPFSPSAGATGPHALAVGA